MVIWRLPILQKSVRYRRVVSCAHSKGRLVFLSGATFSISKLKPQSLSCCTRTTLYLQSRWKSDSLTSQLSIEASVRLLELRQDGGEEQTHRCRRRSTSPRMKISKTITDVLHRRLHSLEIHFGNVAVPSDFFGGLGWNDT